MWWRGKLVLMKPKWGPEVHERLGWLVVGLFCLAQGVTASLMCREFYSHYGPFFDSLSYHLHMASIVSEVRENGLWSGLLKTLDDSTVFLPFVIAAFLGLVSEPDRVVGVWMQIPFMLVFLLSARHCLKVWLGMDRWTATAVVLIFGSVRAVYHYNGGLPDLRMDLILYMLFGSSLAWLLVAMETGRLRDWVICGVVCAACCLSRATSPVYLILTMGPMVLVQALWSGRGGWLRLAVGCAVVAVTVLVLALWYYLLNYQQLYYYYVIWNPDANADLPLAQSVEHLKFAFHNTGWFAFGGVLGVTVLAGISWMCVRNGKLSLENWHKPALALVAAVMPTAFLVLRGAGWNPYVSMPTAFGLLLLPLALIPWGVVSGPLRVMIRLVPLGVMVGAVVYGCLTLRPEDGLRSYMPAYKEAVGSLVDDARARGWIHPVRVSTVGLGGLPSMGIENVLVYEFGFRPQGRRRYRGDGLVYERSGIRYTPSSPVEWETMNAPAEDKIVDWLAKQASEDLAYIYLPDEAALDFLETKVAFNHGNKYARELKRRILATGRWEKITEPVPITDFESYALYVNLDAVAAGSAAGGSADK
jgi:hypothetical protein